MSESNEKKPYLDFYTAYDISPVAQDVSQFSKHLDRRNSLYRHLGIPSALLSEKAILEFGPGSGFNALYVATLNPKRYLLVDGNPAAIRNIQEVLRSHNLMLPAIEIVHSLIENFQTKERFDLVISEGVISWQLDTKKFVRHMSQFVKPQGLMIVTCIDGASFLGESVRRIMASKLSPFSDPMEQRLKVLEPFFDPHLQTLEGRSRPTTDWIQDNIIIKYYAPFFTTSDAFSAFGDDFTFYGSSPHYCKDWRWYKNLHGRFRNFNEHAHEQYFRNIGNLVDYRFVLPEHSVETGKAMLQVAYDLFEIMLEIEEQGGNPSRFNSAKSCLVNFTERFSELHPETSAALREAATFITSNADSSAKLPSFSSFFGRGQQYLSFLKEASAA